MQGLKILIKGCICPYTMPSPPFGVGKRATRALSLEELRGSVDEDLTTFWAPARRPALCHSSACVSLCLCRRYRFLSWSQYCIQAAEPGWSSSRDRLFTTFWLPCSATLLMPQQCLCLSLSMSKVSVTVSLSNCIQAAEPG